MNIYNFFNSLNLDSDLTSLNQESKILQSKIKQKRKEIVDSFSTFQKHFLGGEISYNLKDSPNKFTVEFYSETDSHYLSLFYENNIDFDCAYFEIISEQSPNVNNVSEYLLSLKLIEKVLLDKENLLILSKQFIDKQKQLINEINNIQNKIKNIKLSINLSTNKNKFKLHQLNEILSSNYNYNIDLILKGKTDIPIREVSKKEYFVSFFTFKFNHKNINFFKHNVTVFEHHNNNIEYFISDKEIGKEQLNILLSNVLTYQTKPVYSIKQFKPIFSEYITSGKQFNINYDDIIKCLKTDIQQLNIRDF